MAIEKMSLVHIVGGIEELDRSLMKCCESGNFHVMSPKASARMGFVPLRETNPYVDRYGLVQDVMTRLDIEKEYADYNRLDMDEDQMADYLEQIRAEARGRKKYESELRERLHNHRQALVQAQHLQGLDIRFTDILDSQSATARFGKLPADSYLKLEYFQSHSFFFFDFDHDEDYYWGFYVAPNTDIEEIDRIFTSLYFEEINVSEFAHETPEAAIEALGTQIEIEEEAIRRAERETEEARQKYRETIRQIYSKLKMLHDTFEYRRFATTSHQRFYLEGFVPTKKVKKFIAMFADVDKVICEEQEVTPETRAKPPTKLRTNRFFKPFEMFVTMYGLPDYFGFNPTTYIGLIFVLLFGIMYGDFGQGLCVVLAGALMWKMKKMPIGRVLTRCGLTSMFFGLLYGSLFGIEGSFKPLFRAIGLGHVFPLDVLHSETSMNLLIGSLGIGIVVILSAMVINIIIKFRKKEYGQGIFSSNGVAGILFYGGIVAAVLLLMMLEVNVMNPVFIAVVIVLPLLAMFFKEPLSKMVAKRRRNQEEGGHEKFSVSDSIFEMIEVLLSYATNTLSFLRVGGFVLSHAALMLVVMQFAHMAGTFGNPVVMVLGNIFVMGLEGLLVSIQILRLVYYETFSRFYESDGEAFQPVKIDYSGQK